jgi:hypothetical protein
MAVIGRQQVRVTAKWVKVIRAANPTGGVVADMGGTLLAGEDREGVQHDRAREIYDIAAQALPSGHSAVTRVLSALQAQGYQVAEHSDDRVWLLELVDPSAPEDIGESDAVSVTQPVVAKFSDWLQTRIERLRAER